MKKEDKYDLELTSVLVPGNEKTSALFEESLMGKIMTETVINKERKQKANKFIAIVVTCYISLTLLLIIAVLFSVSSIGILKIPIYELQLKDFTLYPEQLLFYRIFILVAFLSLMSFYIHFILSKTNSHTLSD